MIFAEENKNQLLHLADDMAAAATSFKGQGYEVFIQAREKLKEFIDQLFENYSNKE